MIQGRPYYFSALVLVFGLAYEHDCNPATAHDGSDISVVKIYQRRNCDRLCDSCYCFGNQLIHYGKGLVNRKVWYIVKQPIIVQDNYGICCPATVSYTHLTLPTNREV